MARARFDQGEDQEFHAAFFQFTVKHTAARYTSLKNMSNQGRVHEVCAKNHMPDKHGIGHPVPTENLIRLENTSFATIRAIIATPR
jgi:hypothetical protein